MNDFTMDTCVYIDWDDYDRKFVYHEVGATCTNPDFSGATYGGTVTDLASTPIIYSFLREGIYTVQIVAEDGGGSREDVSNTFPVSYEDCGSPTTYIRFARRYFYLADTFQRSKYIRLSGFANINCPANLANTKSWSLNRVDEATGEDLTAVDISGLTTNKAELYIPTRFLLLGFYKYSI
ncbi:location of vulva defective 1 [Plakobranchus ocellatus]|uniref:Location of vulva defective 1 n=1 Tax=Plakobranchus ocellatus TaxID=259542 RepID=A0AAV3ZK85_9GAST|nr:location of vulva defective 1 [Plakobranchus ocellatus]